MYEHKGSRHGKQKRKEISKGVGVETVGAVNGGLAPYLRGNLNKPIKWLKIYFFLSPPTRHKTLFFSKYLHVKPQ